MPRETCVDVAKELGTDPSMFFKPPCVSVHRFVKHQSLRYLSVTVFKILVAMRSFLSAKMISHSRHMSFTVLCCILVTLILGLTSPRANVQPKQAAPSHQHYFARAPLLHPGLSTTEEDCDKFIKNTNKSVFFNPMAESTDTVLKQSVEIGLAMREQLNTKPDSDVETMCKLGLMLITLANLCQQGKNHNQETVILKKYHNNNARTVRVPELGRAADKPTVNHSCPNPHGRHQSSQKSSNLIIGAIIYNMATNTVIRVHECSN